MHTQRRLTLGTLRALAALALFGCFGICGGGPTPPAPDACSQPSTGSVDTVELAAVRIDPLRFGTSTGRDNLPPRMLTDQSSLFFVRGGQGAEMAGVRLVLKGSDVPPCIAQDTQITVGGQLAARSRDDVATYPLEGGGRATKTIWLPGSFLGAATLTTDAVGKKRSVNVITASTSGCAATGSCPCSQGQNCGCFTGLSDAGRALYRALDDCRRTCDGGFCEEDGRPCATQARACEADLF